MNIVLTLGFEICKFVSQVRFVSGFVDQPLGRSILINVNKHYLIIKTEKQHLTASTTLCLFSVTITSIATCLKVITEVVILKYCLVPFLSDKWRWATAIPFLSKRIFWQYSFQGGVSLVRIHQFNKNFPLDKYSTIVLQKRVQKT